MGKTETRYLLLFSLSLLFSAGMLAICIHKYSLAPLYFFLNQCTSFTAYITGQQSWLGITLLSVWVGLTLVLLVKAGLSLAKTHIHLNRIQHHTVSTLPSSLVQLCQRHRLKQSCLIYTRHSRPLALTIGFFQPKIVLSRGLVKKLSPAQLEAVFLHELYHLNQKHGFVLIVGEVTSSALTLLLPFLHDVQRQMKLKLELAADEFAIDRQQSAKPLATALAKLKSTDVNVSFFPGFASIVDHRLNSLDHQLPLSLPLDRVKLVLSLGIIYCLCFLVVSPQLSQAAVLPLGPQPSPQCQDLAKRLPQTNQSAANQNFSPVLSD